MQRKTGKPTAQDSQSKAGVTSPADVQIQIETRSRKKYQPRQGGNKNAVERDSPPDKNKQAAQQSSRSGTTNDNQLLNVNTVERNAGDQGIHRRESEKLLDKQFAAHHYDQRLGCKTFIFIFVVLSVSLAMAAGMILYFESHIWVIPIFFLFNVLMCWFLLKQYVLKSFLFSYGQNFITSRELRSLNERYCDQYTEVLKKVRSTIEEHLLQEDHKAVSSITHKEGTAAITRLCDFLDRFVPTNEELLRDHQEKKRLGKKTRRVIPDSLFIETTMIMSKMLEAFKQIRIKPVSSKNAHGMLFYYSELSVYDRQTHDSRRLAHQPGYCFERVFPVVCSPADGDKLREVIPLIAKLIDIFGRAPSRGTWPRCLRFCCWRQKRRTSCCGQYTILFGQIKQLGIILKTQFSAEHHWIRTKDGCKLDGMFFRQAPHRQKSFSQVDLTGSMTLSQSEEHSKQLDLIRPCFIICNSNAMFYQQMVHLSHTYYIKMFLEKGINVFTWNYRAYGRSKGKPSPENLKRDIVEVYQYLRETMKLRGKIGIYGRSLGGIPSSFLSNKVDMAIIDRSFCNLAAMARWKYHSKFADLLFKIGSCGWQAQNDFYLIRERDTSSQRRLLADQEAPHLQEGPSSCYKVITQDRHDEIVEVQASLMVGVAKEVCEQQRRKRGSQLNSHMGILSDQEIRTLIESMHCLIDIEHSLYSLIQKEESVEFTRPRASQQSGVKGKQASQKSSKETRQQAYKTDQEKPGGATTGSTAQSSDRSDAEVQAMKRLQHRLQLSPAQLNFDNGVPIFFMTIQIELSQMIDRVHAIGAGILTLYDIININKKTHVEEVKSFFQVMEVYGQDTDLRDITVGDYNYKYDPEQIARQDNLKILRMKSLDQLTQVTFSLGRTIKDFSELPNSSEGRQEKLSDPSQLDRMVGAVNQHLQHLQQCLDRVRQYFLAKLKRVMITLPSGQKQALEPLFNNMETPPQEQVGFLLPLTCGHNRHPNTLESGLFTMHLEIAGFLKPLDQARIEEIVSCQSSPKKPVSEPVKQQLIAEQGEPPSDKGPSSGGSSGESSDGSSSSESSGQTPSNSAPEEEISEMPNEVRKSDARLDQPGCESDNEKIIDEELPKELVKRDAGASAESDGDVSLGQIEFELAEVHESAQVSPSQIHKKRESVAEQPRLQSPDMKKNQRRKGKARGNLPTKDEQSQ